MRPSHAQKEMTTEQRRIAARQEKSLHIDTANMYATGVGAQGISSEAMAATLPTLKRVHAAVVEKSRGGIDAYYANLNLGAAMLPAVAAINDMAAVIRRFEDVVLIGIGGSSLGAKAVWQAMRATLPPGPRIHFVENVDPFDLDQLLAHLNAKTTAIICISKSGATIETVVQYLVLKDWLTQALGPKQALAQQWIITDPKDGWLRALAQATGIPALPVPPAVGGRYSVLTAVGLLPLAVVGVNIEDLLRGAADNAARCNTDDVYQNPALEMAALYYLLDTKKQKRISVMMPYVNRLRLFVDWYCQLWAESLGKHRAAPLEPAGTLPVRAMGAVDQHSQLQMYLESRHDKMFTFIQLGHWENDLPIPLSDAEAAQFAFLKNKTLADVIHAELRATRQIITDTGHPNMTITVPTLDSYTLGELIDLYQHTTVYAAHLYGVNPLDQPAVEKGKKLAVEYLSGREP